MSNLKSPQVKDRRGTQWGCSAFFILTKGGNTKDGKGEVNEGADSNRPNGMDQKSAEASE